MILLAMLTVAAFILLMGPPYFTNASKPPRFGDPMLALQFARDVQDVDWILGDAPSPDREVMRVKQYVDFAFITCYTALCAGTEPRSRLARAAGGWSPESPPESAVSRPACSMCSRTAQS